MKTIQYKSARRQEQHAQRINDVIGNDLGTAIEEDKRRVAIKEENKILIRESTSYKMIESIQKYMDGYYLDGLLGLFPIVGDALTQVFSVPFIYVSLIKIRSIPLTLAIMFNMILDIMIGMIPYFVGNIADFFFKSYKRNFELVVGFVEDDREIIKKVNQRAVAMGIAIIIMIYIIYQLISLVVSMVSWIASIFI